MKIKFLQAFNGDSIWISFLENGNPRNIIIDGGAGDTYQDKLRRTGELYEVINSIRDKKQNIDLLVLTHFDDDHIGGILRWLNQDKEAATLIKKVWFNSGKEIAKKLASEENKDLSIEIKENTDDFYTSPKQGIEFEGYLSKNNLWDDKLILQDDKIDILGITFKFLSPSMEKLEGLLKLYEKEKDYFTSGGDFDFVTPLNDFIEEESTPEFKFKEDKSVPNGSSIAFIMEYGDKSFLFLGDAHPSIVTEGLKKFGFEEENPLKAELMKISHHGSQYNTNLELLTIVKTNNYIISSNATKHGLPNKRTIARIIANNPNATIHFNYKELKESVFQSKDFEAYENFKISSTNEFEY
jgi:beta-lactamase superfamily II metal-dependent hydrolase